MTTTREPYQISLIGHDGYHVVDLKAGNRGDKHIVPPAGEDYAFDVTQWARHVQVSVSPTGRSVRIFVDGKEVKP